MAVTDYYLLNYIESSGTQYIDTRIKCNQDTSIECVFHLLIRIMVIILDMSIAVQQARILLA